MYGNEQALKKLLICIFLVLILVLTGGVGYLLGGVFGFAKPVSSNPSDLTTLEMVKNYLREEFYFGEDSEEYNQKLIDDAIYGMVKAQNDPYTEYMSKEELAQFTGSLESSFVGIGINYTELDKNILVMKIIDFSPAQQAGVQAGDIITAVDGNKCEDNEIDDMVNMIKGLKGTDVTITVLRGDKQMDITITRDEILNTVSSEMKDGIGVITISSFGDETGSEVVNHLDKLVGLGAKKLIIDLRDNTGGYVTTLNSISNCFMKKGDIIMKEYFRDDVEEIDYASGGYDYNFDDIVILVNDYSASCSEVFTMAMKENCNATIVGETTYGKGVAQVTVRLRNAGALKYTECIWKSGKGVYIGGEGIVPDYEVDLPEALNLSSLLIEDDETYCYDSVSEKVSSAQIMLDFLGYKVNRKDGYFDMSTKKALEAFQSDANLEIDGVLSQKCANALNSKVVREWSLHKDVYDTQMHKALELLK